MLHLLWSAEIHTVSKVNDMDYRLGLPMELARIHDAFHVLMLTNYEAGMLTVDRKTLHDQL